MGVLKGLGDRHYGILVKATAAALALSALKWLVHERGYEFVETLPLLTALMGGVVFTLAILVAGVLADFKESERILGEFVSQLRRLHMDVALIAQGPALARMRARLLEVTRAAAKDLRTGEAVHLREIYRPIEDLDLALREAAKAGAASSQLRTVQVGLGNLVRIVDRLEVIVETTFIRAGYYYAGVVVGVALLGLTVTQLQPFGQGLFLYGFAVFLVTGLFLLIADLDNPFAGTVRISTRPLDKLEQYLASRVEDAPKA